MILYLIDTLTIQVDIKLCIALLEKETYLSSPSIKTPNHILHQTWKYLSKVAESS